MTDIHGRIRQVREDMGLTREAFGTAIGASAAKVQALEGGRQRVDHPTLEALSRNIGVDVNWLLLGEDNHHSLERTPKNTVSETSSNSSDFIPIPRYPDTASAGPGVLANSGDQKGYYAFSRDWITRRGFNSKELQIINVRGDSMEPTLYDGDLILLDRSQTQPADGQTFVVRIWDEHVVKHVQRVGAKTISLISANKVYPPREIELIEGSDSDFEIIGRVVASMHEW